MPSLAPMLMKKTIPKNPTPKQVADFHAMNNSVFHEAVGYASKVKSNIIDKASDILSAPSRIASSIRKSASDSDYKVLKAAQGYKGAPNFNDDGSVTGAFKTRSVASGIRKRLSN